MRSRGRFVIASEAKQSYNRIASAFGLAMTGKRGLAMTGEPSARNDNDRGFTYIEILIALVVVGVLFIPMLQLFSHGIYSAIVSGDTITAVNLARWEMERVKNLNLTTSQLKREGNVWTPPLDEPPIEMNRAKWRIFRRINAESSPVEVNVLVYRADELDEPPVATADTLIEDNIWVRKMEDASSEFALRR